MMRPVEKTGEAGAEQIRVSGLTVCDDRGLVAVDGLSLSVRAGEVLGAVNARNKRLLDALNATGKMYVTHTMLSRNGESWYTIRFMVGTASTREATTGPGRRPTHGRTATGTADQLALSGLSTSSPPI